MKSFIVLALVIMTLSSCSNESNLPELGKGTSSASTTKIESVQTQPKPLTPFQINIAGTWIAEGEPFSAYEFTTEKGRVIEYLGGGLTNALSGTTYNSSLTLAENKYKNKTFTFSDNKMMVDNRVYKRGEIPDAHTIPTPEGKIFDSPEEQFDYAKSLYNEKKFLEAKSHFEAIKDVIDVEQYLNSPYYLIENTWVDEDGYRVSFRYIPNFLLFDDFSNSVISMGNSPKWDLDRDFVLTSTSWGTTYSYSVSISNNTLTLNGIGNDKDYYLVSLGSTVLTSNEVYHWIQNRFEYYDRTYNNGNYSDDKYVNEVFRDAAIHFGISASEVRKLYDDFRY